MAKWSFDQLGHILEIDTNERGRRNAWENIEPELTALNSYRITKPPKWRVRVADGTIEIMSKEEIEAFAKEKPKIKT